MIEFINAVWPWTPDMTQYIVVAVACGLGVYICTWD